MKLARLLSTSALSLLLGITVLICAQNRLYAQDQRDEAKPQQQEEPRPEATKPAQDEPKAARPGEASPAEQNEDKPARNEEKAVKQEKQENDKAAKQDQDNDKSKKMDRGGQSDKMQHSAGNRIPDDKFHKNFGRQHTFKVHTTVTGGQPRFQYGGYSFTIVDVWPAEWAYTDDCYIDYVDGEYFLFDLAHPGIRIAVIVI